MSEEISREEIAALLASGSEEMTRELKRIMLSRKDAEMFCDHYCKFPDECDGDQEELDEICEECPLWKKCKEGES